MITQAEARAEWKQIIRSAFLRLEKVGCSYYPVGTRVRHRHEKGQSGTVVKVCGAQMQILWDKNPEYGGNRVGYEIECPSRLIPETLYFELKLDRAEELKELIDW